MARKTKGYEALQYINATDTQKKKWSKEQHELHKAAVREFELAPKVSANLDDLFSSPNYIEKLTQLELLIDAGYDKSFTSISEKRKAKFSLILETMYATGGRAGDVGSIRAKDIDFDKGYIRLEKTKGSKKRVVALPDHLAKLFKEHLGNRVGSNDLLFPSKVGSKIGTTTDSINSYIDDVSIKYSSINPRHFSQNELDPDLITAGFNEKQAKNAKSHTFRRVFATLLSQKEFDPEFISDVMGHEADEMSFFYLMSKKIPKDMSYSLSERAISTLEGNANFNNRMAFVMEAYRNNKVEQVFTTQLAKNEKVDSKQITETRKQRKAVQSAYVEIRNLYNKKGIGSGAIINKKVLPKFLNEEQATQFYIDQDIKDPGKIKIDAEIDSDVFKEGKVTVDRAKKTNRLSGPAYGYANSNLQNDMWSVYSDLKNAESQSRVKLDVPIESMSDDVVAQVIDGFDVDTYRDSIDKKNQVLKLNASNFTYDPEDLYDLNVDAKARKAGIIWDDIPYLKELYSNKTIKQGKPVIQLVPEALTEMLDLIEERKRTDGLAKLMVDQLEYGTFPEDLADDAKARYYHLESNLKMSLEKFGKENPKVAAGFNYEQGHIKGFTNNIINNIPNVLHEKEFTSVSNFDLISIIKKYSPTMSEETKKVFTLLDANKADDLINTMLLEPYMQFLHENEVLDDVVFLKDAEQAESHRFNEPLKDRINLKKNGLPSKNQSYFHLGLRVNNTSEDFINAFPAPTVETFVKEDKVSERVYLKKPFVNITDVNGDPVNFTKPEKLGTKIAETTKDAVKSIDWSRLKLPSIIAGFGTAISLFPQTASAKVLFGATKLGADVALEAYLVDTSGQRRGLMEQQLDKPITLSTGEEFFPNVSDAENQIKDLSGQAKSELLQMDLKNEGYDTSVDSGFLSRLRGELGEAGRRITGNTVGPTIDPISGGTIRLPTGFRENVIEGLDESERQDQRSKNVAGARSQEVIEGYIPNLEESVAKQENLSEYRRRANPRSAVVIDQSAEEAEEELNEINEFSAIGTENQMGDLGFTSQQQGEKNATNR